MGLLFSGKGKSEKKFRAVALKLGETRRPMLRPHAEMLQQGPVVRSLDRLHQRELLGPGV